MNLSGFPGKGTTRDFACEKNTKAPEGAVAGGLIGLVIPEIEAKCYEGKVKAGNILISVHTDNSEELARAKDFAKAGAQDICTTGVASTPKSNRAPDRSLHLDEPALALLGGNRWTLPLRPDLTPAVRPLSTPR